MNISSKSLGKVIVVTVTVALAITILSRLYYALNYGDAYVYLGLVIGLLLSAILYINLWKAKEWARITLGVLLTLRGLIGVAGGLFFSVVDAETLPYIEVLLSLINAAFGILLLTIPGVGRYLRSIN